MAEKVDSSLKRNSGTVGSQQEDYFSRGDVVATSRLSQVRRSGPGSPISPQTPLLGRSISSNFNSPGPGFRADDEYFVFEFGSRYLRAGLGGEEQPRCQLRFGPETQKRVGDYSPWLPGATSIISNGNETFENWGSDHVLWQMDLRGLDLGLVGDKLDRALRTAAVDYLLVLDDSKKRKFIVAVPSTMPHPLLSTLLSALFNMYTPPPSIVLLSSAVLSTVAAGLRSALVVDIGWAGTTVTSIYEYREVEYEMSQRGMKLLSWEIRNLLQQKLNANASTHQSPGKVSLEDVEEVLHRMTWCRREPIAEEQSNSSVQNSQIQIPLKFVSLPTPISVSFSELANPVDNAFFPRKETTQDRFDDEELPLPLLLFTVLLSLPVDVRQVCLSRIVIVGGGSHIPSLKARLLDELSNIVSGRGWDPVANYGSAQNPKSKQIPLRSNGASIHEKTYFGEKVNGHVNKDMDPETDTATHLQPPLPDPPLANRHNARPSSRPGVELSDPMAFPQRGPSSSSEPNLEIPVTDRIRGVRSLGPWAGASLVAGLRVRGQVEIDRDKFLQHGLHGSTQTAVPKRQSMIQSVQRQSLLGGVAGGAGGRPGDRDSGTWNLGVWA